MIRAVTAILLMSAAIVPAAARPDAAIVEPTLPVQLGPNARAQYRDVFADLAAARWIEAQARLDAIPDGPLHAVARAAMYTAKGSPKVEAEALTALANAAPELPQAPAIVRLATARGAEVLPALPEARPLGWLGSSPRRGRTTATGEDPNATGIGATILPLIKDDRPLDAETLIIVEQDRLTPAALTEWRQRVAWSYFLTGDDARARSLAAQAQSGTGEWAAQADWVVGLAAWRQKDYRGAATAFTSLARRSNDAEMAAAGHYWGARAAMAGGEPDTIQPRLRAAARLEETFYGMLAHGAMGLPPRQVDDGGGALRQVAEHPNVRAALALAEIGELGHADELLRWQARIGAPAEHATLTLIAGKLNLPATQLWLAHNGPSGARATIASRYPMPSSWSPEGGWRVDRALVFAHALQESRFQADVTSAAGARGLMQVMPGTAGDIARKKGVALGSLASPATNMEYGQTYIEQLRDMAATGGLLPKVIAAYNCGPAPLARWNVRADVDRDPLLYIESIPYWETRGYVTTVLRNYWMYQQQAGAKLESRTALVQGMWPRFPGLQGAKAVRFR